MVLAAGSRRYSWGPEVTNDNEDGDSEPWPSRHTSVHVLFFIVVSFFFSFFFFFMHQQSSRRKKKKINSRNCDSNFSSSEPPTPFFPSIFIAFFSSSFSFSRKTFVLVPFFITALLFLSYFHWQFAVHCDPGLIYFLRGKILRFLVYFPFLFPLSYLLVFINGWPTLNFPTFPRVLTNFSPCCCSPFVVFY